MHVLVVVLGGLSIRHVRSELTPHLLALAGGGTEPTILGSSLLACASTAAATLAAGCEAHRHGVLASRSWSGARFVPAERSAGGGDTLLDRCERAGLPTAASVADPRVLALIGAARTTLRWPFDDRLPDRWERLETTAGHQLPDEHVVDQALLHAELSPVLQWVQFDGPHRAAHEHGPDEAEALDAYRRTDAQLGRLLDRARAHWSDTIVVVTTDHGMEAVTAREPIRLEAVEAQGWVVHSEGSGALAAWPHAGPAGPLQLATSDGDVAVHDKLRLLWTSAGRWFGREGDPVPAAVHGGPMSTAQLALVSGGHPSARWIAQQLHVQAPRAAQLRDLLCHALVLDGMVPQVGARPTQLHRRAGSQDAEVAHQQFSGASPAVQRGLVPRSPRSSSVGRATTGAVPVERCSRE